MIDKAEKATGKDLLLYDATPIILEYLDLLPPSKLAKAPQRPTGQEQYVWTVVLSNGRLQPYLAKEPTSKLMVFSSYTSFLK